jgi:hypothetical protein
VKGEHRPRHDVQLYHVVDGVLQEDSSHGDVNPAVLMADAITILSSSWNDANVVPQAGDVPADVTNSLIPTPGTNANRSQGARQVPSATVTTIASGLLTGSTTKITTDNIDYYCYSGGGHNLVRFLEGWSGATANFYGSFGRLFESTQFVTPFKQAPSKVFENPHVRNFSFNSALKNSPPPSAPNVTVYSRGTIFTWYRNSTT